MIKTVATNDLSGKQSTTRAFTLVEMLVALAVLSLALTIVGYVFSITTKTVSQAAALSEMQAWTRQFLFQIEEDLKYCDPSKSVLIVVGRTQAAAKTRAELDARLFYRELTGDPGLVPVGYDPRTSPGLDNIDPLKAQYSNPRADILGFFTSRSSSSQAPPTGLGPTGLGPNDPYVAGSKFSPQFVVYGHAAKGDIQQQANGSFAWTNTLTHIEESLPGASFDPKIQSVIPADEFVLARRATILESPPANAAPTPVPTFLSADHDRIVRCQPNANGILAGDVAQLSLNRCLQFLENTPANALPARATPYPESTTGSPKFFSFAARQQLVNGLLYLNPTASGDLRRHIATIAPTPPSEFSSNMVLQSLPGCAWFQVEFLMPEDPRNSLEYTPTPPNALPLQQQRFGMPLWTEVSTLAGKNTYVFVPDTPVNRDAVASQLNPATGLPLPSSRLSEFKLISPPPVGIDTVANRRIRMWPYAIRITIKVFDPQGQLTDPVERSIIHRFD